MHIDQLETPVAIVDLDKLEANINRFQAYLDQHGIANRPHIKTHKIPAIAHMQLAAGAVGITCQKLGEAEVFADAGVADDFLLTFNVLGEAKTERLAALIRRLKRMAVVLDNETVARGLSEAGRRHDVDTRFLIECDTGGGRNGGNGRDENRGRYIDFHKDLQWERAGPSGRRKLREPASGPGPRGITARTWFARPDRADHRGCP